MDALPTLDLVPHTATDPVDPADEVLAESAGARGEIVTLWAASDDAGSARATTTSGPFGSPDPRPSRPMSARITVHSADGPTAVELAELPVAHPAVQPLPGGRFLVVGARCQWHHDGPDRNAVVYDDSGRIVASATFGDGIKDVLTTAGGDIWVSYSDEGVHGGGYGWSVSEGRPPPGESGLVRFSADLQPAWRYPTGNPWGDIDDCYAVNVADDEVWVCYYNRFPVVRIRADGVTAWRNGVRGARALSVAGDRIAFFHTGYPRTPDVVVVGHLSDGEVHQVGEYRLVLPGGRPPPSATFVARGRRTFVLTDGQAYRLDLTDIPD